MVEFMMTFLNKIILYGKVMPVDIKLALAEEEKFPSFNLNFSYSPN